MNRQFTLHIQHPKPKTIGRGVLDLDKAGEANFYGDQGQFASSCLATICRTRIESASACGIGLSGFEQTGVERNGTVKYRYQEWWLTYV